MTARRVLSAKTVRTVRSDETFRRPMGNPRGTGTPRWLAVPPMTPMSMGETSAAPVCDCDDLGRSQQMVTSQLFVCLLHPGPGGGSGGRHDPRGHVRQLHRVMRSTGPTRRYSPRGSETHREKRRADRDAPRRSETRRADLSDLGKPDHRDQSVRTTHRVSRPIQRAYALMHGPRPTLKPIRLSTQVCGKDQLLS